MLFARVNGVVIHYALRGRAGAPTIVFANSLGTDFRIWDDVVARLERDFRIVLYDKRGHGLSESTPQPYRLEDHVEDLEALLSHVGIARTAIVGLSVGGLIAQRLAAKRPELVSAMVLSNTAHKIGTDEMWNQRIATINEKGVGALADGVMQRWFTPTFRRPENAAFVAYTAMLVRTDPDGYAGTCAALRDTDLTESTRGLKLPVLCLVGDQDGATPPELVRSMADLIAGSRFKIIDGAGHIPNVEQPEITAQLIGNFLRRQSH